MRNAYKTLVGKPEGKRPIGRPWHRWDDNIKMVRKKIGSEGVDWIDLAGSCEHGTVMNFGVP
jgi:hypothetical protein